MADFQNIIVETHGRVGLVRLNRPAALNALCDALMQELGSQLLAFDADSAIGCIVITGNERAFAVWERSREWTREWNASGRHRRCDFGRPGGSDSYFIQRPVFRSKS